MPARRHLRPPSTPLTMTTGGVRGARARTVRDASYPSGTGRAGAVRAESSAGVVARFVRGRPGPAAVVKARPSGCLAHPLPRAGGRDTGLTCVADRGRVCRRKVPDFGPDADGLPRRDAAASPTDAPGGCACFTWNHVVAAARRSAGTRMRLVGLVRTCAGPASRGSARRDGGPAGRPPSDRGYPRPRRAGARHPARFPFVHDAVPAASYSRRQEPGRGGLR